MPPSLVATDRLADLWSAFRTDLSFPLAAGRTHPDLTDSELRDGAHRRHGESLLAVSSRLTASAQSDYERQRRSGALREVRRSSAPGAWTVSRDHRRSPCRWRPSESRSVPSAGQRRRFSFRHTQRGDGRAE